MPSRRSRPIRPPPVALLTVALAGLVVACSPVATAAPASPTPTASEATPAPTTTASATVSATAPTIGACDPAMLAARVTAWEGAAGHRIASVALTNASSVACTVPSLWQPQLVDGAGNVLIDSPPPSASAELTMAAGGVLTTMVQDGNYCGPDPVAPVSVAFVLPGGAGRVVATALSPTDTSGLPPCLGPGSPGDIEMQSWAP